MTTYRNSIGGIKWSRDRWRHVTPKSQTHDPNMVRAQYLGNSWRCYLATNANYYIVCSEAVRSAILATAWLLVSVSIHQSAAYCHRQREPTWIKCVELLTNWWCSTPIRHLSFISGWCLFWIRQFIRLSAIPSPSSSSSLSSASVSLSLSSSSSSLIASYTSHYHLSLMHALKVYTPQTAMDLDSNEMSYQNWVKFSFGMLKNSKTVCQQSALKLFRFTFCIIYYILYIIYYILWIV